MFSAAFSRGIVISDYASLLVRWSVLSLLSSWLLEMYVPFSWNLAQMFSVCANKFTINFWKVEVKLQGLNYGIENLVIGRPYMRVYIIFTKFDSVVDIVLPKVA